MPATPSPHTGETRLPGRWATALAENLAARISLFAALVASGFEGLLLAVGTIAPIDHAIIGALIAGTVVATWLAREGRNATAISVLLGALWCCAAASVVVHGTAAPALPTLVVAAALSALWVGARAGIAVVTLSLAVLVVGSRALPVPTWPVMPVGDREALVLLAGQFVFLGGLMAFLSRAIEDVRVRLQLDARRIASTTRALEASQVALADTSTRYAELVRALPDAVLVLSETGVVIEVNDATQPLFGRAPSEFTGQRLGQAGILKPEDSAIAYANLAALLGGRGPGPFIIRTQHADGTPRWCEVTTCLLPGPVGERQVLAIARDVSARLEAERALHERDARWLRASAMAQLGSWELDLATGAVTWDEQMRRLHDVGPDFVPYVATLQQYCAPEAWPAVQRAFTDLLRTGTPMALDFPLISAAGRRRYVRVQGEAERRDGRTVRLHGIVQDITALHEATELLRESAKLEGLGRLAGGIAHDFNNLLTAILGYAEDLEAELPEGSIGQEDAREIRRAGERARDLTQQLLAFARRQVVRPRDVDLAAQVTSALRFLQRLVGEDVTLAVDVPADIGAVRIDPTQLEQLLLNLAVNARDAMPGGGRLGIAAHRTHLAAAAAAGRELAPGDYIELTVQDTGAGMPPEVAARVFEPFFTTKKTGHGTGLGLATAYGVVRQAGGHIAVHSEVGHGTQFTILLPRVAASTATAAPSSLPDEVRGGTETILLVEDEATVSIYAERILRQAGYRVHVAESGNAALARLAAAPVALDLLVTDVVMPGLSGPDLAEALLRTRPDLPVLYVSGYTQDRLDTATLGDRARFLPKPYGRKQLLTAVRTLLDGTPAP